MINTQTAPALSGDERRTTDDLTDAAPPTPTAAAVCNNDSPSNKIIVTNVIETSGEMDDDTTTPESNTNNNASTMHNSESNNSLNCARNGIDRKDSANNVSSAGSGTLPRTDSNPTHHLSPATSSLSPILLSPCRSVDSCNDDDLDEIGKLFETKSKLIERWLREKAPQDVLTKVHAATDNSRMPKSPKRTSSVTSDLFQLWLASSPAQVSHAIILLFISKY